MKTDTVFSASIGSVLAVLLAFIHRSIYVSWHQRDCLSNCHILSAFLFAGTQQIENEGQVCDLLGCRGPIRG